MNVVGGHFAVLSDRAHEVEEHRRGSSPLHAWLQACDHGDDGVKMLDLIGIGVEPMHKSGSWTNRDVSNCEAQARRAATAN